MNSMYLYFTLFYLVPFGIALAMPGWRSLFGYGLSFGSLIIWLFASGSNGGGNGLAVALGLSMVMFAGGGLISGMVTRAILLALPEEKKTVKVRVIILIVGFILLPIVILAEVKWQQWNKRPPFEACLSSKYPVKIEGAIFYLPPAPNLTLWTDMGSLYLFQTNEGLRAVCEFAENSKEPIPAVNLHIDNQRVKFAGYPVQGRYCQTATAQWGKDMCNSEYEVMDAKYPLIVDVYSDAEFNSKRMLTDNSYKSFLEARGRAKESNTPFTSRRVGIFDRYGEDHSYWIAHEKTWENEAGEPFTLYCYNTTPVGNILCLVTYRLRTGPHLTYQFHTPEDKLEIVARRVDKNMRSMLYELSQP
ncbi:MAG: hypothetical protein PHQ60_00165 [Sideroxydans sp.]|nr:hypothetical protein [Sideroxydans sp.]